MLDATVQTNASSRDLSGTAYGRKPGKSDDFLTGVKAGTPAGEWLRRYWHPIALSGEVTSRPRTVKLLGEELVIFRNGKGAVGLLHPRCVHRGTSLYYGRVEDEGIRCCYHGWLFDVEGNCLEQPCEPEGGLRRDAARQPWYPVQERYGLVFAYMGPADRMPVLPRYDILENLEEGEFVEGWGGDGCVAAVDTAAGLAYAPYHWMQMWENVLDHQHAHILHAWFTEDQVEAYKVEPKYTPRALPKSFPKLEYERWGIGAIYNATQKLEDGSTTLRRQYAILPNIVAPAQVGFQNSACDIVWYVATDDESWVAFVASKTRKPIGQFAMPMSPDGRGWSQLTEEERQDYPGDYEAQTSQGAITLHSEEHLVQSDIGVVLQRRLVREQIKAVQNGEDPLGVFFDEAKALIETCSGNFKKDA